MADVFIDRDPPGCVCLPRVCEFPCWNRVGITDVPCCEGCQPLPSVAPRLVLVCGSRHWTDAQRVREVLAEYADDKPAVVHGGSLGADRIAGEQAAALGLEVSPHPADWGKHGRAAGPIRNRRMLDLEPDLVIAFGTGRGTQDTVDEATRRGIPVRRELS